ncbi:MAG: ATP-dependent RNA helicase RhlB [Gammaproteobacteria bacterium]|nr:ATP-dependent RNA helicase RhlB [Gammaproteobacteria bacterium]MCI0591710.1 ATP-dependent RNA helicase RhlB [Gammaproteobacteria bacterium]
MATQHLTDVRFAEFSLHPALLKALVAVGFSHCTPIQAVSLPLMLSGKDVAGQAQTGTGKTAAFLLATMDRLLMSHSPVGRKRNQPRALILSPTRELAIQIHRDAIELGQYTPLSLALVYGGVDYERQRGMLEDGVDILIGTPGRLIDYYKQGVFDLKAIEVAVLDEADRMFDLGFIRDIRYLLRRMPKPERRLNMLFSATLSLRVTELAYEHMNNPEIVRINPERVAADNVSHVLYHLGTQEKIPLLLGLLKRIDPTRTIVFVNTKRSAEKVWAYLEGNGFHAAMLSGDVPQRKRQTLMAQFARGDVPILVATDLAARGLHITDVSHIFNFDLPQNGEDYVHRIGRTARAGASGDAVSFACEEYVYSLMDIEAFIGHKLPVASITDDLLITPKPPAGLKRYQTVVRRPKSRTSQKKRTRGHKTRAQYRAR